MTPEKLDMIIRQWRHHWHWLPKVDLIVVDEVHLLGDQTRGGRLEAVIVRLRLLNPFARIVLLSATLGNTQELADWLGGVAFQEGRRVVPLQWRTRTFKKADQKPSMLVEVLKPVIESGGKSIVFVQSKKRAEHLAQFLQEHGITSNFHHAGLDVNRRATVESGFRTKAFDVLVATSTLEVGLNLPARQVVLYDLQQFQDGEFRPLSVVSAWQRAGRAGRPGLDVEGEVVVFRASWEKDLKYEQGRFEPIVSALSQPSQLCEQIVVSFASGLARTADELDTLFSRSLLAKQRKLPCLRSASEQMVAAGFLEEVAAKEGFRLRATKLGRICSRLMVSPDTLIRVRRLLAQPIAWTYFDLLLLALIASDGENLLSVDYEDLEKLGHLVGQNRSTWLPHLAELNTSGTLSSVVAPKRLLHALNAAAALCAWIAGTPIEMVAEKFAAYVGDLSRLQEGCVRLLSAIAAFSELPGSDDETAASQLRSSIPSDRKSWISWKVKRLILMVEAGLDQDEVTLTFIPGIGKTWARRLGDAGIHHAEELAQSEVDQLLKLGQIGVHRATRWIKDANNLLQSDDLFAHEESAGLAKVNATSQDVGFDVYRLKRSWALLVEPGASDAEYKVTGGLDPHVVRKVMDTWHCDCLDFTKGKVCKHLLATRRFHKDQEILRADGALRESSSQSCISLTELWSR
jgi:helicase